MKKDDSIYLDHILASLSKIMNYVNEHNLDSFLQSDQTQDAVIRQLEIVGEATKRISTEFRAKHSTIPWTEMRDKLIHDYIDVDLWIVWETTQQDVPKLRDQLSKIA